MTKKSRSAALDRVIQKVGSGRALAEALGIKAQAVSQWKDVPFVRLIQIEHISGIPRQELRPELYADTTPSEVA